jgi:DNA-binding GntR family transcriptional regulator
MEAAIARDADRACKLLGSHMRRSAELLVAEIGAQDATISTR